jgi:hypothetical protein
MARSHHEGGASGTLDPGIETPNTQQAEPERRPTRFSLNPNEEEDFTLEYLQFAFRQNPEQLHDRINQALLRLNTAEERVDTLEAEALRQRQHTAEVMIENESLQAELLNALRHTRQETPAYERKRSTKLPDPPIFTDGKDMKYSDWLSRIRNKLRANGDHYPTDEIQIAYVEGRIGGEAATHISPRLRADAVDPYRTVQDLLDHLNSIYEDPNRLFTAKNEFKKIFMNKAQTFHDFYTRFLQLSSEAKISAADLKYELNSKLSFSLQKAVISHFNSDISFQEFAKQCAVYDQSLKAIEERESRTRKPTPIAPTSPRISTQSLATPTAAPSSTRTATPDTRFRPKYDNEFRQQLSREGKCFICHQTGHMMNMCPKRRTDLRAIEQTPHESGNDNP